MVVPSPAFLDSVSQLDEEGNPRCVPRPGEEVWEQVLLRKCCGV